MTDNVMEVINVKFKDWSFEVNRILTEQACFKVLKSGAETCNCNDCKNYVANRENVFPNEVKILFESLGIDYKKEVEITSYKVLDNGLHCVGGWFHFKGKLLNGKDYRILLPSGGYTVDLTNISDNFSIGFAECNDLTYFNDKTGLVQIEFMTNIPWVIDKHLEPK